MGQAYLSCNLAWRFLVYRKSSPEGFEENIFSLCSLVELFNLIFVRSVQSASLYPKVVTASLVAWQSKTSSFELFCGLSTCALCPKAVFAGFMTVFDFDIYLVVICFTDSGDATGLPPLLHFLLFVPISQPGIHCLLLLVLLRDGLLFEPLWGASFSIQQFKWSKWTTQHGDGSRPRSRPYELIPSATTHLQVHIRGHPDRVAADERFEYIWNIISWNILDSACTIINIILLYIE